MAPRGPQASGSIQIPNPDLPYTMLASSHSMSRYSDCIALSESPSKEQAVMASSMG